MTRPRRMVGEILALELFRMSPHWLSAPQPQLQHKLLASEVNEAGLLKGRARNGASQTLQEDHTERS